MSREDKTKEADIKLVRALQADFKELYQPQYTTNYKANRMIINMELAIMRLENTEKYISKALKAQREELIKEVEGMKEDNSGETASKNENGKVEDMFDCIAGSMDFTGKDKELFETIRLFGKMRFNQAIAEVIKKLK